MAVTLRQIYESDLEKIMAWRMSESVTKYMNTNPKLTLEGQKKWLASISEDNSVRNWMIEVNGIPAGLINLIDIDWENGQTSWGYYIGEKELRSLSLAISLEMSLYDYVFDVLNFSDIHNETFSINDGVVKLHLACGCKIIKEVKGEIEKEGVAYDVTHLSMNKNDWNLIRDKKKYEKINFDIYSDKIGGCCVHHWGIAVSDMEKAILAYSSMGWKSSTDIIKDTDRNIWITFMKYDDRDELIELISPINEKSPVTKTLQAMRDVATPYHICYEVDNLERVLRVLKNRHFVQTTKAESAVAFEGRRVIFLLNKDAGLIELLEKQGEEVYESKN